MSNVSIIVPVFNDGCFIDKCIESLKNQTYPKDLYEKILLSMEKFFSSDRDSIRHKYLIDFLLEDK